MSLLEKGGEAHYYPLCLMEFSCRLKLVKSHHVEAAQRHRTRRIQCSVEGYITCEGGAE